MEPVKGTPFISDDAVHAKAEVKGDALHSHAAEDARANSDLSFGESSAEPMNENLGVCEADKLCDTLSIGF
jgi:hypothetical protein